VSNGNLTVTSDVAGLTFNTDSNSSDDGGGAPSLLWLAAVAALFALRRRK